MSYRDWREKTELRLSPTERVVLILMLIAILVLVAYRIFDAVPKAESSVAIVQTAASSALVEDAPIDLNTAGRAALLTLPGIGESKADAILAYREEHGPFKSVDDLLNVSGIGPSIVDGLRDRVTVRWVIEVSSSD